MSDNATPDQLGTRADVPTPSMRVASDAEQRVLDVFIQRVGREESVHARWDVAARYTALAARLGLSETRDTHARGVISHAPTPVAVKTLSLGRPALPRTLRRALAYVGAGAIAVAALILSVILLQRYQVPVSVPPIRYATDNGQRATITLSDGTTVLLNVASQLDVPVNYMRGDRTLHLQGAALFTVVPHSGTPLTVVAGTVTAHVLGTSFVMRHYATDRSTLVAVRDGKVSVNSAVVTANRQVVVMPDGVIRQTAADAVPFGFATGMLQLTRIPLRDAIPELNRWYNADIRLGDPQLADRRVTGEWSVGSLADLAERLHLAFNARVVREGQVITIYSR